MIRPRNFVHVDEIWKDHVNRETQSFTCRWPERWGYLTEEYRKMNCELQGLPPDAPSRPPTKLPPIPTAAKKQETKLPVTTAQLMGWYIKRPNARPLEVHGRNARGHVGFLKLLNWPAQGVE